MQSILLTKIIKKLTLKKIIPDTNIFLRFILNDIPSEAKKAEIVFSKSKTGEIDIIIPQIVILEIHFTLEKYYQFSKKDIIDKLKAILSADYFKIDERAVFLKALDLWITKNISLPDAFLISYCEENNGEIFSFDKKLNKLL